MQDANGVYDTTRPWNSNDERLVSERLLEAATAPQDNGGRPPAWAKQGLFPDRFGYEQRALSVQDCFRLETQYGNARDDYSRVTSGYSASSTPSLPLA